MSTAPGTPVALVVGVDGGLGLEVAEQLALAGVDVLVAASSAQPAKDLVGPLLGLEAVGVDLELTDDESLRAAVSAVVAARGRLDLLVSASAGTVAGAPAPGSATRTDLEEAWWLIDAAVFGVWRLTRAFLPLLAESGHPRVVTVMGGPASRRAGDPAPYRGSSGLDALTCLLAAEFAAGHIAVEPVAPTPADASAQGPG